MKANSDWVLRHTLRIIKELRSFDPARILYGGEEWRIHVASDGPTWSVDSGERTLSIRAATVQAARKVVARKFKAEAKLKLSASASRWSKTMGVEYTAISVRDQRSKWGSCSARGGLSFNWRLVLAPPEVLQAIVIHELAHLAHLNHGPEFWVLVGRYDPGHKAHEKWLKDHQGRLMETF